MAVSTDIAQKANDIRTKVYGKDVRESLASGLESMSSDINQFKEDVNTDNENFKTDTTAAEASRATAENARVTAETTRQQNETARQTAEQSRIAAETARETAFSQMQHIDANAELTAARQGKDSLLANLQAKDSQLADIANQQNNIIQNASSNMGTCQPSQALWAQAEKEIIKNLSDFDNVSGMSYSLGEFYATASGTLGQAVKALQDTNIQNLTVQALAYYDNTQDSEYIGISTSDRGTLPITSPQHRLIGFRKDTGFIYNDGSTLNTLIASSNLSTGWYEISLVLLNSGTNCVAIVTINKQGNNAPQTFVESNIPYANNIIIQSAVATDRIKNIKYIDLINTNANLLIPNFESYKNFHTPLQFADSTSIGTAAHIPASYNPNIKNKCVIFFHGLGGHAKDMWNSLESPLFKGFLDAGYVIIASDYTNPSCWGNAQSSIDIDNLISLYQKYLNIQNEYYLVIESMGGITGLNAIAHSQTCKAKAVIGIYPTANLTSLYDNGNGSMAGSIAAAYGITDPSQFATKANGYDPMLRDGNIYKNIPMLFWSSYSDTTVPRATNADAFASKINELGGNVTINTSTGNHGDPSNFVPQDAVNFFGKY